MFNENLRVKIPGTIQFMRLGYGYQSLKDIDLDPNSKIVVERFALAIEKINKRTFSKEEISGLLKDICRMTKNNDLGKEFYNWLINPMDKVHLIDFGNIENNDFAVVNELVFGEGKVPKNTFRPDITVLINGMPLGFMEVKIPDNEGGIQEEFRRMIDERLARPYNNQYFNMFQVVCFSNNMDYEDVDDNIPAEEVKAGSFYSVPNRNNTSFSFFREEDPRPATLLDVPSQRILYVLRDNQYSPTEAETPEFQTNLSENSPCNRFITSLFSKDRIMYLLRYGIAYVDGEVPEKQIMRYPQFFASIKILEKLARGGKSGIIWHTQGSGKTGLAAFCNRIIADYYTQQGITARFFFVVDRLDLLTQTAAEMADRGCKVTTAKNKFDFAGELNKPYGTFGSGDGLAEWVVVNIQKFEDEDMPTAKNEYDARIQRVFFIDECHRSYTLIGEYFKNLMMSDPDAIYIALTGTPLLSKRERSNMKFGDYIHKYFYDKSIADGYTLRIKRESIDTLARTDIRKNLELENPEIDKSLVMESPAYIDALGRFIESDFLNFRYVNTDNTIGGMIVCGSNPQAKLVQQWFQNNSSELSVGLVITDPEIPEVHNKNTQLSFKNTLTPDILIVHQMLTTGYDVHRLKKMYLLRNARQHTLLQTISRVNRPYHGPSGHQYQYGYVVDFVDIEKEYDRTIKAYTKELEDDMNESGEDEGSLAGIVVGPDDIHDKCLYYKAQLEQMVDVTDDMEVFSRKLVPMKKEDLLTIRRFLNGIKSCHTEFLISRATKYAEEIDTTRVKDMLREVQHRIDFVNLKHKPTDTLAVISNTEIVSIIYDFLKTRIMILNLGKLTEGTQYESEAFDIVNNVRRIQDEIKENKNRSQSLLIKLDEFLSEIFAMLDISDLSNLSEVNEKLLKALAEVKQINAQNERLAERYDGNFAYVKTYQDCLEQHPEYEPRDIEDLIGTIYDNTKEITRNNSLIMQSRQNYVAVVKMKTTQQLLKAGLYKKLNLKDYYTTLLGEIYSNTFLYK